MNGILTQHLHRQIAHDLIRSRRMESGITQQELAESLGVTPVWLTRVLQIGYART